MLVFQAVFQIQHRPPGSLEKLSLAFAGLQPHWGTDGDATEERHW